MANTGNITVTERDMNPQSPTYDTTRTRTYQDLVRCPTEDLLFKVKYYLSGETGIPGGWRTVQCNSNSTASQSEFTYPNGLDRSNVTDAEIGYCVTSIGYGAFMGCSALGRVIIPETVTSIGESAFDSCVSLRSISIPDSVTSIGSGAFRMATNLERITFPKDLTTIENGMCYGCKNLTTVEIQSKVTSIGSNVFNSGTYASMTIYNLILHPTTPPSIYNTFQNCGIARIYVPAESVEAYKTASGWSSYANIIRAIPT